MTAGPQQLGSLIKNVAGQNIGASEKVRRLAAGAGDIAGVTFKRIGDLPGATGIFRGAPRAIDGKSPLLVVLRDGRVFKGFDDALIPDPSGVTSGLRILLSALKEVK